MDVRGDLQSQQLALARVDVAVAVSGRSHPSAPEPQSHRRGPDRAGLVVVLGQSAVFAAEVRGRSPAQAGNEIVGVEVVVDLGIGRSVPVSATVLVGDSDRVGAGCVVTDEMSAEMDQQPSEFRNREGSSSAGSARICQDAVDRDRAAVGLEPYRGGEDRAGEIRGVGGRPQACGCDLAVGSRGRSKKARVAQQWHERRELRRQCSARRSAARECSGSRCRDVGGCAGGLPERLPATRPALRGRIGGDRRRNRGQCGVRAVTALGQHKTVRVGEDRFWVGQIGLLKPGQVLDPGARADRSAHQEGDDQLIGVRGLRLRNATVRPSPNFAGLATRGRQRRRPRGRPARASV